MSQTPTSDSQINEPPKGALLTIFFIVFMDLLGFGIIIPLLPLYAKEYHATPLEIGLLLSIYSACQFIASPILGALSDRYRPPASADSFPTGKLRWDICFWAWS